MLLSKSGSLPILTALLISNAIISIPWPGKAQEPQPETAESAEVYNTSASTEEMLREILQHEKELEAELKDIKEQLNKEEQIGSQIGVLGVPVNWWTGAASILTIGVAAFTAKLLEQWGKSLAERYPIWRQHRIEQAKNRQLKKKKSRQVYHAQQAKILALDLEALEENTGVVQMSDHRSKESLSENQEVTTRENIAG